MKEYFKENLIMTEEEEEEDLFQKRNNCWIWKKFSDDNEDKFRDHCHGTDKFRGVAHKSCNYFFK